MKQSLLAVVCALVLSGCVPTAVAPSAPPPPPVPASPQPAESTMCTAEYAPVCGEVQIQCITTPCDPVRETFSNACEAEARGAKVLYQGECREASSESESLTDLPEGTFGFNDYGNFYGEVYVRGYTERQTVNEAFCTENCETYQAVSFKVIESGNPAFAEFLEENHGNSFVQASGETTLGGVMLGCYDQNEQTIYYANDSDEHGMAQRTLTEPTVTRLLNASSADQAVNLKLTKLQLSGGRGAPTCYSHFYGIALWPDR